MNLPKNALVAVVDGEKLVLFKNTGDREPELTSVPRPDIDAHGVGSGGHQSSASNPDNDTQAEDGFAAGVADVLNKWALAGKMEHLYVVAAPKTLGELRKHWHKALSALLVGELAKDLTGRSGPEIAHAIAAA